ncbi:MAG: YdcF family protein [Flavobacteriales bacterium]|nr:YdcF family protein [Flavobacteriales bacterium]
MRTLWSKRWFKITTIFIILMVVLLIFKNNILRGMGNYLVAVDPLEKTEMCFVLGGNSYERGISAIKVFEQFPDQRFAATGGNYPYQILCLDTMMFEAELTKHWMVSQGVPEQQVDTLTSAHSTMDESEEILRYCQEHQMKKITVISSSFHMRRVRWVFEDKFEDAGIQIIFHGAAAVDYDQNNWWTNEEGLIMANNEFVKLLYYLVKY